MTPPDPADRLSMEEVAALTGKAAKSVRRWARVGVTVNGRRVRLASLKVGSSRITSRPWLSAFLAAQNPDPATESSIQTPAERDRELKATRKKLAAVWGGRA